MSNKRQRDESELLYPPGATVQVRQDVKDPNYPDIPLGGYRGIISEADPENEPPLYLIEWDDRTLENMPNVLKQRSERDGFDSETMWLMETDLEASSNAPVPIQQPTLLVPKPLNFDDPEDRIRDIFDLTSDDELPEPTPETLATFHAYLAEQFTLPTEAMFIGNFFGATPDMQPIQFIRLLDVEEADPASGLLAEIEKDGRAQMAPLIQIVLPVESGGHTSLMDYNYWYSITAQNEGLEGFLWDSPFPTGRSALVNLFLRMTVYGAGFGAAMGAMLNAIPSAYTGMLVGAGVLGSLAFLVYSRMTSGGSVVGGAMGGLLGAILGAVLGVLFVGVLGTLPGAILGSLLGRTFAFFGHRPMRELGWSMFGSFVGGFAWAVFENKQAAFDGARNGAIVGAVGVLGLVLFFIVILSRLSPPSDDDLDQQEPL